MKFQPVTSQYRFDESLTENYPDYLRDPIYSWIKSLLWEEGICSYSDAIYRTETIGSAFLNDLNINFREHFPKDYNKFFSFVFASVERTTNFIALCLQNYATPSMALKLEKILSIGGSAYAVLPNKIARGDYDKGNADLIRRVPEIVNTSSEKALNHENLLGEAWRACYSRHPDYEKVVSKCVDVLEGILRDNYFPADRKLVLTRFIKDLEANPGKLKYKGLSLVSPANMLIDLSKEFITIRGQHTKGTGRIPIAEEAEFVLHYTIFLWNLHN